MKKTFLSLLVIVAAAAVVMAFAIPSGKRINPPQDQAQPVFPENVQKIIENSCFDCHSVTSSNEKARTKLNFSEWSGLSDAKKIGNMEDIKKVVRDGDMPPLKYVSKFPDKTLVLEQKNILYKWIDEESDKLLNK
jgi:hypothetical protein